MKVVKRGNTYRKLGWYRENEKYVWIFLCVIMALAVMFMAMLIGGGYV